MFQQLISAKNIVKIDRTVLFSVTIVDLNNPWSLSVNV